MFQHGRADQLVSVTAQDEHAAEFTEMARERDQKNRAVKRLVSMRQAEPSVEALMIAGPSFDAFVWERRAGDQRAYSLCGVTHTLSSDRIIASLANYLLLPLQPWDALVCTSQVARDVVTRTMQNYADYLGRRGGAGIEPTLKLPVIPLGVDGSRYVKDEPARQMLREHIGAAEEDLVVLFLGRFTFHAKAHPVPMYLAAERAAKRMPGRKVHLVMVGQAPNDRIMAIYREGAEQFAKTAAVHFIDGQDDALVHASWQGADVFLSLSDNIQETFGLTPIEAMAAGLPAVVSDWDGYKDTIIDGETGFRVPTTTPAAGDGFEQAFRYQTGQDNYDRFIGRASMMTSCDLDAAADALVRLAEDPELRARMGDAGRARARTHYDWSVIIRSYEDLWLELRDIRAEAPEVAPRQSNETASPFYPDPFDIFAPHPSFVLGPDTIVTVDGDAPEADFQTILAYEFCTFSQELMLPRKQTAALLRRLSERGLVTVGEIEQWIDGRGSPALHRTLPWLAKFGLIKLSEQ
ncbi:glycosyltransferase family 4 protein [Nisaea nitritireducens]|uniref:glycosyltransferase family 4 protein n=1 Tax=Nisaea nitritireducens TaxID=568392 RepID=UPI001D0287B2|nr:glycosyltransferase family 4 protein [Nisaea nitritireducens]